MKKIDSAEHKRIELNTRAKVSAEKLISRAFEYGHKAVSITDSGNIRAFPYIMKAAEKICESGGYIKPIYGIAAHFIYDGNYESPRQIPVYDMTILAQNAVGLKNLYRLVSVSYDDFYFKGVPHIPFSELQKYREGLIIGSAGAQGEFYRAFLENKPFEEIQKIAKKYDYFEIQPVSDNEFSAQNDLCEINKKIAALADNLGKLCAAAGGVNLNENDGDLCLKTTDEMLKEFEYLGKEKAFETVVTNTNAVADMTEEIRPVPQGIFPLKLLGADEKFPELCRRAARERYGENLPEAVQKRLERELELIEKYGFSSYYMAAKKFVDYSKNLGYSACYAGQMGSSLAAFLAGITDVDPLPPHYFCTECHYSDFSADISVNSGFDLPQKNCPHCGCDMIRSGHNIPFEIFMRYIGWKKPNITLYFSSEILEEIRNFAGDLFEKNKIFRAAKIKNTGRSDSIYPCDYGEIFVIPDEYEALDFTPVQSKNYLKKIIPQAHFDSGFLKEILPVVNLRSGCLTIHKRLEDLTGIKISDVPTDDPQVYKLFTSTEPLGLSEDIGVKCGILGIPNFDIEIIMQILAETQPKNFADLIKISGFLNCSDTWKSDARKLIKDGVCTLSDVISSSEDVMLFLVKNGVEPRFAYNFTEFVRMGNAEEILDEETLKLFNKHKIPKWFAESCGKIFLLGSKARATELALTAVRMAWFKLYYPKEFYAAVFEEHNFDFKNSAASEGLNAVKRSIEELRGVVRDTDSPRQREQLKMYLLVLELMARGLSFHCKK